MLVHSTVAKNSWHTNLMYAIFYQEGETMTEVNEKYVKNYALEFEDREVQKPLTYDMKDNTSGATTNVTLTPTPRSYI